MVREPVSVVSGKEQEGGGMAKLSPLCGLSWGS